MRFKNRYVLAELRTETDAEVAFSLKDIFFATRDCIARMHGDYGVGLVQSTLKVSYYNAHTHLVLLRVSRDHQDILTSSLPFLTSIRKTPVAVFSLHLGGTIRSCQKEIVRYNERQLLLLLAKTKTEAERKSITQLVRESVPLPV
eukprot:m.5530 g.5530  ORF g.5530 m.5530 type:complete len:145 (+) comp5504_c0_seq1:41-475(+)